MKLGLKRKILLVFIGVLLGVSVLDALLASYFTNRQNQGTAFATLKRDLLTWQGELQDITLHMRTVALSATGETVALNQLSALKALDYKLADALDRNKEVKEAARTLAFSQSVSLNRLHLVLRSGGFSAIAVYIDGKLSHQVSVSEVGMFVQRSNGARVWVKAAADGNGNLPLRSWPAWQEGAPPPVAASLLSVDRPGVSFTYPSADSMLIEVAVPVEGVIEQSRQQGEGQPPELSVIDPRIAGSASDPSLFAVNRPSSPFAVVVFQKRIDQAILQTVERKTGMWPLLFSPDGQHSQQMGPLSLSLQQLLPNLAEASPGIKAQTVSIGQGSFYAAVLPWQFEQQPGFVLALVASQDSTLHNIRQTVLAILTVTSLILAFSIGVGIFWVGRFIDPIIALTNAVKAIGLVSRLERGRQSDYRLTAENLHPLAIQAPGEIGDLAWAFDVMIGELHHSFDSLEQRVEERTVELRALHQVLEEQNLQLEEQSFELSLGNRSLQEEIGERKLMEDLLRLREQEFRALVENAPDPIFRYAPDGRRLYVNPAVERMSGKPAKSLLAHTPQDTKLLSSTQADKLLACIRQVVETGEQVELEVTYVAPDGRTLFFHNRYAPEFGTDGEVASVLAVSHDITERKKMENALRESRKSLTEAQRIAHVGSWELDLVDNVLAWSDEIFRIFEIDREQFGASYEVFIEIIHPDDREAVNFAYIESLKNREPYEIEHRLLMADGRIKHVLERCETRYADDGKPLNSLGTVQDITERKAMEESLARHERELRALAESSPGMMGCFYARPDGSVCMPYTSANIWELFGLRPEDVADNAESLLALNHPGDAQRVSASIAESARTMTAWHMEYRILHPTRGERWMEGHTNPQPHPDGGIAWYGYVHDITERKQAEMEKRRLIDILEQSADFIGSADMQGNLTYHNRAALRMVGLPEDADLSAMRIPDMHPAWAMKLIEETAMPVVLADGIWRGETTLLHRDGREVPVSQLLMLHRDADGKPAFMATIMQDITERKRTEDKIRTLNAGLELRVLERTEELRQQTHYLRTMIDTLPMFAWLKDTDSRFLVVNQALAAACSHSVDDMVGKSDLDVWLREHAEAYRADDAEVMATGLRKAVEEPFVDAHNGAIWVETFKAPVVDEDGRVLGTVGVSRDIRERKAVEAAREAALAEAERLARLRSEFMARMSHELRTPLNGILGYSQILLGENRLNERQNVMVNVMQQSGEHLLSLINDILDFAKIEAGKQTLSLSDIHLPSFLRNLADIVSVKAEQKQLTFICDIAAAVPEGIRADGMRLKQVLLNLLSNAVKYSEQGQISLRVTVLEKPFSEGAHVEFGRLRFEIQDSGIGIDAGQLESIFKPFEQAADIQYSGGGTGLGLVISRELIRLMGSEIFVSSRVGEGSTFWFDLDAPDVDVNGDIMPVEQHITGYLGPRQRVLVVDDTEVNRALLIDMLSRLGFETVEAANGRACLNSAETRKPDLILLDMVMPEMDGLETARRLRQMPGFGQTPIIAVSAGASGIDVAEAMAAGVNVFLTKPIEIKRLMGQIAGLLKFDWIYALPKTESSPKYKPDEWLDAPPQEEMRVLRQLAAEGSMRDIIIQADYLDELDASYRPFAEQLRSLAKGYQSKAVLDLVERYIDRNCNYSAPDCTDGH
ncbi:PAS domain S-box protein [Methylobacter sp.]|uniref:PAS domain S-box protein n=1 Tax=Methylobacter sp. TaxID=2051955 RepID=UPI002488DC0B|nr:PAS domain S-box protein [Methylobacter sp.]MDI1276177.1 PAS domain S-box protein [Methylobacter sp.]MDI1356935.1 PAS domain S-box protein [Methylobacter sp.]